MKKVVLLVLSYFALLQMQAGSGYNLKVTVQNNTDSILYVCHYYGVGKTVYKDDSCRLTKGTTTATYKSDKKLVGGIYILLFGDRSSQLEFLLNDGDKMDIAFDRTNIIPSAKFTNSPDNDHFYEYQRYIGDVSKRFQDLQTELGTAKTKADTAKLNEKNKKLNKEVNDYRLNFVAKYPKSLGSLVFNALQEPEVPEKMPMLADGKTKDSTYGYRYFKSHYWDKFDFKDERLVYTPLFDPKLESYFTRLVIQTPDSFNKEADKFLKNFDEKQELFKYSLWWLTRHAETTKVMGMDESFVYLVEKYYMTGKAPWLEDSNLQKYITQAQKLSPNVIGKQAPEINIPDINEKNVSLTSIVKNADFTIVAFYDPTCHHCQQEIPSVDSLVRIMNKKRKIQIYGVENAQEDEKWKKFIIDKKLGTFWTHLHDPYGVGKYRTNYNVYSNPIFYLLDNKGTIVGKRFDHTNLEGLIEFLEKRRKETGK
jgi:peroxiredoxin